MLDTSPFLEEKPNPCKKDSPRPLSRGKKNNSSAQSAKKGSKLKYLRKSNGKGGFFARGKPFPSVQTPHPPNDAPQKENKKLQKSERPDTKGKRQKRGELCNARKKALPTPRGDRPSCPIIRRPWSEKFCPGVHRPPKKRLFRKVGRKATTTSEE